MNGARIGLLLVAVTGCTLTLAIVHGNDSAEHVEVRVNAQRLADGRTEFAVQHRTESGEWSERILPRGRFLPASPGVGRWLHSTSVDVRVPERTTLLPGHETAVAVHGTGDERRTLTLTDGIYLVEALAEDTTSDGYSTWVDVDFDIIDAANEEWSQWIFASAARARELALLRIGETEDVGIYSRLSAGELSLIVNADDDETWRITFVRVP